MENLEVIDENGEVLGSVKVEEVIDALEGENFSLTLQQLLDHVSAKYLRLQTNTLQKLQYSELLEDPVFTDIINSLYDGVFITNGEGIPVKINKAYERISGLQSEQVIGYHMKELIKAGYFSKSASLQVLKEKRPITLMQTLLNGRKIIVSGTPIFTPENEA